jgi:hypothetical protein
VTDLGTVSRREWRHVAIFAALVMLITMFPYVVGWLSQGDDWEFGGFLFGVDDGYSYLAKMRIGARGDWLFTLRYTSEPHDGALLFLPYILLGKLTALFFASDSPDLPTAMAVTFHAARVVCGAVVILVSYRFVAVFLRNRGSRMLALVLITLGGGLGWLLSIVGLGDWLDSLPVDFYVPEGYSFLILFGLPHMALSRSAMLIGFMLLFRALLVSEPPRLWLRYTAMAGLCWIIMGLCVPFYIAVVYLVLGCWGLAAWIRERRFPWVLFWRAASAGAVVLPLLLYTGLVFLTNDVLGRGSSQNRLPSPHVLHYVFGYIALAVPAAGALRWAWSKGVSERGLPYLLLATWIVIVPFAVYLPINVQRRLAEGVIVPLSILAVAGLRLLARHRRRWRFMRHAVLALALPTALLLWLGGTFSALSPGRPLFHPRDELTVMDTLNRLAPENAVVLSMKETGNYLPARTDLLPYVGHGPETLDSSQKEAWAEQFFAGELDAAARKKLLHDVDYVFFGELEQEEAGTRAPAWAEDLRALAPFDLTGEVIIYEVPHD